MWPQHHQPLGFEGQQRFANRRLADPESRRQIGHWPVSFAAAGVVFGSRIETAADARLVVRLASVSKPVAALALLVPLGEAALARLMPVARVLRQRGVLVDLGTGERRLPRELERANRLGVGYAVIAGDSELVRNEAIIREMASGSQRSVPLARLGDELMALARGRPAGAGEETG